MQRVVRVNFSIESKIIQTQYKLKHYLPISSLCSTVKIKVITGKSLTALKWMSFRSQKISGKTNGSSENEWRPSFLTYLGNRPFRGRDISPGRCLPCRTVREDDAAAVRGVPRGCSPAANTPGNWSANLAVHPSPRLYSTRFKAIIR